MKMPADIKQILVYFDDCILNMIISKPRDNVY